MGHGQNSWGLVKIPRGVVKIPGGVVKIPGGVVKIPGGVVKIPGICGYCPRWNSRKVGTYALFHSRPAFQTSVKPKKGGDRPPRPAASYAYVINNYLQSRGGNTIYSLIASLLPTDHGRMDALAMDSPGMCPAIHMHGGMG